MELERLIGFVNEKLGGGDDLETIIAEFTDMGLCAPEQAVQLRERFAPPGIVDAEPSNVSMDTLPSPEQAVQHGEHVVSPSVPNDPIPAPPDSVINEPAPPPERSVPVLQIDWGTEPRPDIILSPQFTIQGGSFAQPPLVHFPLDSRISQNGWKWDELPTLKRTTHGWSFYQQLQLEKIGQYVFHIVLIDPQPGFSDPGYYHTAFRMDVVDPKEVGQRRKVKIQAVGNAVINFDQFGKDADIEIVGDNVTFLGRDTSVVDKMLDTGKKADTVSDWTTTIPLLCDPEVARRVPYLPLKVDIPNRVRRLTMTESSGTKHFVLIGGHSLSFGRDDPDRNIQNDVPLEILPGTQEKDHADEFATLNGLFSRTHACLEVLQDDIYLRDHREGGIRDATILGNRSLIQGSKELMFSSDTPRSVLFSKMLSMTFEPHKEGFLEEIRYVILPEFPPELLNAMYSPKTSTGISSVCITPEQHFKQKDHAGMLLSVLKKAAPQIAESDWWKQWFNRTNNVNPRNKTHEYWFIPSFVTLGGLSHNKIQLNSQWNDVRFRILFLDDSLYVENISRNTAAEVKYGGTGDGKLHSLLLFRPVPLCSGFFIQKEDAVLRFE